MKIERVNDHQIRCTLTKDDLADREIKLSELAYGTDKAKDLFRDLMQQASFQYGFEAEDIPLMIEAIPLNSECIVLIITKVEDPEELDTRFSKFAPSVHEDESDDDHDFMNMEDGDSDSLPFGGMDAIKDLYKKFKGTALSGSDNDKKAGEIPEKKVSAAVSDENADVTKMYSFDSISAVTNTAHVLPQGYTGPNTLYKNVTTGRFSLILKKGDYIPEEFNKMCNILSEYGTLQNYSRAAEAYLSEHCETVITGNALQTLSRI